MKKIVKKTVIKKAQHGGSSKKIIAPMNKADSLLSEANKKRGAWMSLAAIKGNKSKDILLNAAGEDTKEAVKLQNKKPLGPTKFKKNGGNIKKKK